MNLGKYWAWGARPPTTVSTRKLTKNVEVCQPLLRSSPIPLPSWGQWHAFCEAAPGDFSATMDAGKKNTRLLKGTRSGRMLVWKVARRQEVIACKFSVAVGFELFASKMTSQGGHKEKALILGFPFVSNERKQLHKVKSKTAKTAYYTT